MTKRTGKAEGVKTRKAKFTFSHQRNFELDQAGFDTVCSVFGFTSTESFEKLIPKNGPRDTATEKEYRAIDKKILPHLNFEVFFSNFAKPELLFKDYESISWNVENPDPRVESFRITYLALWDSDSEDKLKRLEIGLEAEIIMNVIDGVDVENPDGCEDTDIVDQFRECRNMFNFSIKDFEYDDDEEFDHDWGATFCN